MTTASGNDRLLDSVTVTAAAERFMRRMVRFGGLGAGAGFRLVVSPGGCSGMSSQFTIEPAPLDGDRTLSVNGLKVFLPAESCRLLEGVTIDFLETPTQTGFAFIDPKGSACACQSTSGAELVQLTTPSS
ncbi:HesB/IscA family protein [Sorangium sp. So ce1024]|uniref:HesB/IscA family protein n=2 Tax=unclassified Sorangium TaxID=2621164 RepID=UPI003EFC2AC9